MSHAPVVLLVVALALIGRTWPLAPFEPDQPPTDPTPSTFTDAVAPTTVEASVTRVVDGSSLDAYVLGRRTGVGYLGVETPSLNRPCGPQALARNRDLAGGAVLLEEDSSYQLDAIGRRLYYAYTTTRTRPTVCGSKKFWSAKGWRARFGPMAAAGPGSPSYRPKRRVPAAAASGAATSRWAGREPAHRCYCFV